MTTDSAAPAPYVLALDEGTTNAKAHTIAPDGSVLASGSAAVAVSYPRPGWVEQDAEAVWAAQTAAIRDCLAGAVGPRPALRSPTSASPSSSETPSPTGPWPLRRQIPRTRRFPVERAAGRCCYVSGHR